MQICRLRKAAHHLHRELALEDLVHLTPPVEHFILVHVKRAQSAALYLLELRRVDAAVLIIARARIDQTRDRLQAADRVRAPHPVVRVLRRKARRACTATRFAVVSSTRPRRLHAAVDGRRRFPRVPGNIHDEVAVRAVRAPLPAPRSTTRGLFASAHREPCRPSHGRRAGMK